MLKAAVIGAGRMGRGHISVYQQLEREGYPVKLVAICDIDEPKLRGENNFALNIAQSAGLSQKGPDYSAYHCYTDAAEMLKNEELDVVDVVVPTFVHADVAKQVLNAGVNVLCEKPMSLTPELCQSMIDTANANGVKLMIGQCLHFWKEYEILHDAVVSGKYGKPMTAYFYRGGPCNPNVNPSWQGWILDRARGGGALFDQHIHDIDVIRWCFGTPKEVSTVGKTVHPQSAYDICSTKYFFDDPSFTVDAHDSICYQGKVGFRYGYNVTFEKATMLFDNSQLTIYEADKEPEQIAKPENSAYYYEIKYFLEHIVSGEPLTKNQPEEAKENVRIALAELKSADLNGERVAL